MLEDLKRGRDTFSNMLFQPAVIDAAAEAFGTDKSILQLL
jgi:hypothetical protein